MYGKFIPDKAEYHLKIHEHQIILNPIEFKHLYRIVELLEIERRERHSTGFQDVYNAAIDGMESLILAQATIGIAPTLHPTSSPCRL